MRRGVLQLQNAVLRHLAVSGLALLIGIGGACPERRPPRPGPVRQTRGQCQPRRRQGQPAQDRRIRRGGAGHQRPGRQPGMRLARPPGGDPDVARRPRYRVPASRSLRPVRLPGRPHPGDFPLPGAVRPDRSKGDRTCTAGSIPAGSIRSAAAGGRGSLTRDLRRYCCHPRLRLRRLRRPPRRRPRPPNNSRIFRPRATIRNFCGLDQLRPQNAMAS